MKAVDDILISGVPHYKEGFIEMLSDVYELGTITHFPGRFSFFGLLSTHSDDFDIYVHADDKLNGTKENQFAECYDKNSEASEPLFYYLYETI